jgi:hypothetical protein
MSRQWTVEYYNSLGERLAKIVDGLLERLEAIIQGRSAPEIETIPIGSARYVRAAVLFFDIRGFSTRTASPEPATLTLAMLDCVIPIARKPCGVRVPHTRRSTDEFG